MVEGKPKPEKPSCFGVNMGGGCKMDVDPEFDCPYMGDCIEEALYKEESEDE